MTDIALRDIERRARQGDADALSAFRATRERRGVPLAFIDLETRSRCDLRIHGGRRYAADPSSEILCAVAVLVYPNGEAHVHGWGPWVGPQPDDVSWHTEWPELTGGDGLAPVSLTFHPYRAEDYPPSLVIEAVRQGAPLIAWNAHGFDRHVWTGTGYPEGLGGWVDALDRARRRGLPGGLDACGARLYGVGKDAGGKRLMMRHSLPQKARGGAMEGSFIDPAPASLTAILRYCARDALLMAAIWHDEDLGAEHVDDDVLAVHEAIDERGVPIDLELAGRLAMAEARHSREAEARASALGVSPTVLRSSPALRSWLRGEGVVVEDVTSSTIEGVLQRARAGEIGNAGVVDVCTARMSVARVAGGKLIALASRSGPGDARYRGWAAYGAAHTGRWAGRGTQLHNFPRPREIDGKPLDVEEVIADLERLPEVAARLGLTVAETIAAVLRAVVCAPPGYVLAVLDWKAIEARGLLWLADDDDGLDVYRRGLDPYKMQAVPMFGVAYDEVTGTQRQAGKLGVLACGYQGGQGAVERIAAKSRISLLAMGLDAQTIVDGWRDANPLVAGRRTGKTLEREDGPPIVLRKGGLWKALDRASKIATDGGGSAVAGRCEFRREGPHLVIELPSGRTLVYRDAAVETVINRRSGRARPTVTYTNPHGMRVALYGGLLSENVTQAVCRDILAENLVRFERAGLPVVLHVHDEIACQVFADRGASALAEMRAMAEEPPPWAAGFPLATSGAYGPRWGK